MQANLRSVLAQISRGGRDVGSHRSFRSYLGNSETKGGRRRFVTGGGSQINEKLYWFGRYMTYGYCAVTSWAIIQMFEHRRTIEIDLAERRGSKPKTSFRDVLRWFGA
ncbi:unnamed protein product [Brassica oleracea var. botrytis]|uniref:Uncharacterized protein n=3 Tax=Brassica TaxID=3705 RepID=A0ABQ7Z7W4_BRANA|nr:PREDICTED: uncharacterized protein LOC106298609 [Brassica oleracea var. oleracea]XP_013726977.1 uncharacterized protein LOC106430732 [Brassica napus]KAH0876302.1 hypothetical protein HID58_073664 [Brassica napus]VDD64946.1 unnamed protein product [Brassica oleracea]